MGAAGPVLAAMDTGDPAPWQDFAACAQTDPEAFFPADGKRATAARMVCAGCFVRQECLDYAVADASLDGVWGGTTPLERRALRRQAAPAATPVAEKTCTGCGITKPLTEFHRNTHNSTGRGERCKTCRHQVSKRRWQEKAA